MADILKYFGKKPKKREQEKKQPEKQTVNISSTESRSDTMSITELSGSGSEMSIDYDALDFQRRDLPNANLQSHTQPDQINVTFGSSDRDFFSNKIQPCCPVLKVYPRSKFGQKFRRFNSDWYQKFNWLEYNKEKDSAFCFACRVFHPNQKETTFTKTGFQDWHHALDNNKGLPQHNASVSHQTAMKNWACFSESEKSGGSSIGRSFVSTTSDQKTWLFAVFHVTKFLCANGLPFRGTNESDISSADGLYLRTFGQLLFKMEPNLEEIHKNLPQNAKYTSHQIQNEAIEILASLVKENIAEDIREAKLFTIMADGTTDKNGNEIQGLVCRYLLPDGSVEEHCLDMKGIEDRSAKGVFKFVKDTIEKFQLVLEGLVSQSFDGANVMSGELGGLQRLISDWCKRYILYVHCFLHKIHLVITFVMQNIEEVSEYFSVISSLYKFFKKSSVSVSYEGTALKRLIETRWSGHFQSTSQVNKNYAKILEALTLASKNKKLKSEDRALAIGLLSQIGDNEEDPIFAFINCMLMDVLKPIDIVVKTLQSSSENFISALEIIKAVQEDITLKRQNTTSDTLEQMTAEINMQRNQQAKPRRSTSIPSHFQDFVVTETIPSECSRRSNMEIFLECLDLLEAEFTRRFSTTNIALWDAMSALSPSSDIFLEYQKLKPLFDYAEKIPVLHDIYIKGQLSEKDLEAECRIFARVLKDKDWPKTENGRIDLVEVARIFVKSHQEGAPILASLYKLAITAGFTSTRVECAFSALTRVDTPQRRSMNTDRECNLAYLAFESDVLMNKITFEDFFNRWSCKPRAI